MISILAQERVLGAALGSAFTGLIVFQQRKDIYDTIAKNQPKPKSQINSSECVDISNLLLIICVCEVDISSLAVAYTNCLSNPEVASKFFVVFCPLFVVYTDFVRDELAVKVFSCLLFCVWVFKNVIKGSSASHFNQGVDISSAIISLGLKRDFMGDSAGRFFLVFISTFQMGYVHIKV
nr:hypothetical protein CTI12_AA304510 [Tanacetum cinerariifolium]